MTDNQPPPPSGDPWRAPAPQPPAPQPPSSVCAASANPFAPPNPSYGAPQALPPPPFVQPGQGSSWQGAPPPGQPSPFLQPEPRPRNPKALRNGLIAGGAILALVLGLIVVVVATRPPGLQAESGKLRDTEPALGQAQQYWQQNLVVEGYPDKTEGECHYLVNRSSGLVDDAFACGPFRRADASTSNVWDLYRMNIGPNNVPTAFADGQQIATALPAGTYLAAANGKEETVDTTKLPVAALPEAQKNSVFAKGQFTVSGADAGKPLKLGDTTLTGFSAKYQVAKLQTVSKAKLTSSGGDVRVIGPPQGQQLYLLTFGQAKATNRVQGTNTLTMRSGGGESAEISGSNGDQVLFSAAAKDVTIQLDADGATQSVELFSGKKKTDPRIATLGKKNWPLATETSTGVGFPRRSGSDGNSYDLDMTFKKVEVTPYDGSWAGDGKVMVTADYDSNGLSTSPGGATYTLTCTATVPGGRFESCDNTYLGNGALEFTAPEADSFTVNVAPTMHVRRGGTNLDVTFPAREVTLRAN